MEEFEFEGMVAKGSAQRIHGERLQKHRNQQSSQNPASPERSIQALFLAMGMNQDRIPLSRREILKISGNQVIEQVGDLRSRDPNVWSRIELGSGFALPHATKPFTQSRQSVLASLIEINPGNFNRLARIPNGPEEISKKVMEVFANPLGGENSMTATVETAKTEFWKISEAIENNKNPNSQMRDQLKRKKAKLEVLEFLQEAYPNMSSEEIGSAMASTITKSILIPPQNIIRGYESRDRATSFNGKLENRYQKLIVVRNAYQAEPSQNNFRNLNYALRELHQGTPKQTRQAGERFRHPEQGLEHLLQDVLRNTQIGKRTVSSGRAVIIAGNAPADEIGLPWKMAWELTQDVAVEMLLKKHDDIKGPHQALENLRKGTPYAVSVVRKIFEDRPVIAGRQPTLHVQNMASFQVNVKSDTKDDTISWPIAQCSPMNADFDGDTCYVYWPMLKKTCKEIHQKLSPFALPMLRRSTDQTAIMVFSHECLDGLCKPRDPILQEKFLKKTERFLNFLPEEIKQKAMEPFANDKEMKKFLLELIELREKDKISVNCHREIFHNLQSLGFDNIALHPTPQISRKGFLQIKEKMEEHFEKLPEEYPGKEILQRFREDPNAKLAGIHNHSPDRRAEADLFVDLIEEMNRYVTQEMPQENDLHPETRSMLHSMEVGARMNSKNFFRICFASGVCQDTTGGIEPHLIPTGMIDSHTLEECQKLIIGQSSADAQEKTAIPGSGHVYNLLIQCAGGTEITAKDCGTQNCEEIYSKETADLQFYEGNLQILENEHSKGPEGKEGKKSKNKYLPITPKSIEAIQQDSKLEIIRIRTPEHCDEKSGVCACCAGSSGTDPKGNAVRLPEVGMDAFARQIQGLCEPLTQDSLRQFKLGGAYMSKTPDTVKQLQALANKPSKTFTDKQNFQILKQIFGTRMPAPALRILGKVLRQAGQKNMSLHRYAEYMSSQTSGANSRKTNLHPRALYGLKGDFSQRMNDQRVETLKESQIPETIEENSHLSNSNISSPSRQAARA